MADATGKVESGILDGNGFYEGRAPQCLRANERLSDDDVVMTPHYCSAYWRTGYVGVQNADHWAFHIYHSGTTGKI